MLHAQVSRSQAPRRAPSRATLPVDADNQMWWGYYLGGGRIVGVGTRTAETYWAGIEIPRSQAICQGKTIKGLRVMLSGTQAMKDVFFWMAESLPQDISSNYAHFPVDAADLVENDWSEIALPQPFPIPEKTLYVGITFTLTEADSEATNFPVLFNFAAPSTPGSFWLRTTQQQQEWTDLTSNYSELALQLLLDGDFPHNAVDVPSSFNDVFALAGGSAEATLTLTSKGLGAVSSIDYTVGDANADGDEQHMDLEPFSGMNAQRQVRIPLKADAETGRTPRYITVTKVNGVENAIDNATTQGYFVTLSKAVPRRTLVEEFTGTWCGWCPPGITGMEMVNAQFPGKAITIAVHGDDPMAIDYGITAPSYPYAYVDRGTAAHPYFGLSGSPAGICELVGEMNQTLAEASVELQTPTLTKAGSITFKTDVAFNYSTNKSTYAIGYVLVADGLTGTGRSWAQANYLCNPENKADYEDDDNLRRWTEADDYVYPMTYDHVAIAAKGMDGGLAASIGSPIVDGAVRTLSNSFALTGNTVLQDFDHLSVVAVLFNTATGTIVNADIQPVAVAEDFAVNKMQVGKFDPVAVVKGTTADILIPVANYGRAGIHSIDYLVRANGTDSETKHIELEQPITTFGIDTPVAFNVAAQEETGFMNHTIVITAVNGQENEATSGRTANGTLITIAQASPRKTVVEEYTGTWCMWCPRGLAGLKRANDEYPDDAVLMSIHSGSGGSSDPMQVSAFSAMVSGRSFPSCDVNRYRAVDPYMGEGSDGWGLGTVIEDEQRHLAEAAVNLQQPVLDEATGVISFQTDVTFQLNRKSAPYLLSYVLVADGLTGDTDDWTQINAYAAYYQGAFDDDPYMKEVTEWDIYATGLVYNHVAIAANGIQSGITGSLKNVVEEGQVQSHSGKFNIANNPLAQKATELRVIALLYDKTRKQFINADQKRVVPVGDDAVRDLAGSAADSRPVERYSIDGKRVSSRATGLQIVRMADGSVRKMVVPRQ